MVILVEGTFRVDLTEGSVTMAKPGDYLVWDPGSTTHGKHWPSQSSSQSGGHPRQRDL
jgi:hypothetical protein